MNIKKIINKLKSGVKEEKAKPIKPIRGESRERDMRQEAMDMGSHNAEEFFGGK